MSAIVSILVPIYGVERYIEKCVRSLMEQSYEHIEYIFVDDCTPDRSIEILQRVVNEYPQRKDYVRIYKNKKNSMTRTCPSSYYEGPENLCKSVREIKVKHERKRYTNKTY